MKEFYYANKKHVDGCMHYYNANIHDAIVKNLIPNISNKVNFH